MKFQTKLDRFAALLQKEQAEGLLRRHPDWKLALSVVKLVPGRKYTKVDVDRSGAYMVENGSGRIYGIKGYGVIHRGHQYGNLNTITQWNWSEYHAIRKPEGELS